MKRLVVALMVANAMFFTWQLNEQISARIARARHSPPSAVNAPSLTLLSELPTPPALRPPPANPLSAAPPVPVAAVAAPSTPAPMAENPGAAELPVAAVAAPSTTPPMAENPGAAELPVAGVVAPGTPAPVAQNPGAAESPVAQNPGTAESSVAAFVAPSMSKANVPSGVCLRVGPYAKTADYVPLVAWLQPRASGVSVATIKRVQRKLFWIYLEPSSAVEAQTKLQDLARRGVHDYLLIRRTGVENAISLGVFSSQDAVNRRLAEVEKQGYRPIVVPRDETIDQHFVAARLNLDYEAIEAIPPVLLGASKAQRVACDEAVQR